MKYVYGNPKFRAQETGSVVKGLRKSELTFDVRHRKCKENIKASARSRVLTFDDNKITLRVSLSTVIDTTRCRENEI